MNPPDAYKPTNIEQNDHSLTVHWPDNHTGKYHSIWLRHQCECPRCGSPMDGIRDVWLKDLPARPKILQLTSDDREIHITWDDDHHHSAYSFKWLRDHCYSSRSRALRKHRVTLWDCGEKLENHTFDYRKITASPEYHLRVLESVRDYGFCKLENIGGTLKNIKDAATIFGPMRITHFGVSEINEKTTQYNVGDSGRALLPHMDETYRIQSVGITLLQMVNPSEQGGHSILVDGFEVARRLRESAPDAFDMLCTHPVNFKRHHKGRTPDGRQRLLFSRSPIIQLDESGAVTGARINERHISPLDMDESLIEPFYESLRKLFEITYRADLRITLPLKADEGMVFDNQRVLHGRTEFTSGHSARHVRSCTVDTEEFYSTLRLLQMELGRPGADYILYQGI